MTVFRRRLSTIVAAVSMSNAMTDMPHSEAVGTHGSSMVTVLCVRATGVIGSPLRSRRKVVGSSTMLMLNVPQAMAFAVNL